MGKITKILKSSVDPLGVVFKDKKKKVTTTAPIKVAKQDSDAEVAERRKATAVRLAASRKNSTASSDDEESTIFRPGARSAKLFGE